MVTIQKGEIMQQDMEKRIQKLMDKGVVILDPRQTYIGPEVDPDRIYAGSVLFPEPI